MSAENKNCPKTENRCEECHLCCEYFVLDIHDMSEKTLEFAKTWGVTMDVIGNIARLMFYRPCQYLTVNGCMIYEQRPDHCRKYTCELYDSNSDNG